MNYKAIIYSESPIFTLTWSFGTTNPNLTSGQQDVQIGSFETLFEVREVRILLDTTTYYLMPLR